MPHRQRRRERRPPPAHVDRSAHPSAEKRSGAKAEARRRAAFAVRMDRMRRWRTILGALGFVPLVASLLCGAGAEAFCGVPREIYLGVWAGLFGSFLDLTVRMWRERRRFEAGGAA